MHCNPKFTIRNAKLVGCFLVQFYNKINQNKNEKENNYDIWRKIIKFKKRKEFLAIDVISLIVYFAFFGMPH